MTFPPVTQHKGDPPEEGLPKRGEIFDGKYRIEGILGVGGMGVVFAARHLRLDDRVAIKILLPQWSEDPSIVSRFMQEGRSSLKIKSEHVVRVLDDGVLDGRPYLVLEYLDGKDFDTLVAEKGPLPIAAAADSLLQACEALAEAHVAGVIHRDLKPANLFLTHRADGSPCVKVLDFGISKVIVTATNPTDFKSQGTLPTMVMGSPHYMSPEQMQTPKDVDERSDIWALGAILHELLAGKPPFQASSLTELYARILRDPPPPLTLARADVPQGLENIVLRCLEKDPTRRFPNVAVFARALAMYGSAASQASADRISRIVEGGIAPTTKRDDFLPIEPPMRAVEFLDSAPPRPIRRPVAGYVALGMVMLAIGSGIGWKVVEQSDAIHRAEAANTPSEVAPPPAALAAVPTAAGVPISQVTTTSAATQGPAATARAPVSAAIPAPPVPAIPAPVAAATPAPRAIPAPVHAAHHVHHARPMPLPTIAMPTPPPGAPDNPYADTSTPPVPEPQVSPATTTAAPAGSSDATQLFDERK